MSLAKLLFQSNILISLVVIPLVVNSLVVNSLVVNSIYDSLTVEPSFVSSMFSMDAVAQVATRLVERTVVFTSGLIERRVVSGLINSGSTIFCTIFSCKSIRPAETEQGCSPDLEVVNLYWEAMLGDLYEARASIECSQGTKFRVFVLMTPKMMSVVLYLVMILSQEIIMPSRTHGTLPPDNMPAASLPDTEIDYAEIE